MYIEERIFLQYFDLKGDSNIVSTMGECLTYLIKHSNSLKQTFAQDFKIR